MTSDYEEQQRDEALNIVHAFSNYVNRGGNVDYIVKAMTHEHNTLQQRMTVVMLQWFIELSQLEYFDARNEASVKIARKIVPILEENNVALSNRGKLTAHLPFV